MTEPLLDRLRHVDIGDSSGGRPYRNPDGLEAAAEIERLHEVIRQIVEREATLSTCDGDIVIQMDAAFTDEEREAIEWAAYEGPIRSTAEGADERAATLRGLLERMQ